MNEEWIIKEVEKISKFSESGQGITRLSFSKEALLARQYIASLMTEAGLTVRTDWVGNIIGRMDTGENREEAAVMAGSHIDTPPCSSKYHGILGILSAIAAAHTLKTRGPLSHPIEIIAFVGEEAGRFGISFLGSKTAAGALSVKTLGAAKDKEGNTLSQALAREGVDLKTIGQNQLTKEKCKAFLELYIVEGQILEKEGAHIGIAKQVAGVTKCKITVSGCAAHAGWTPMDERQDALVSAAMIILAVEEIAKDSEKAVLATVSNLKVLPGTSRFVPGAVEMWVDISSAEQEGIIEALQEIKDAVSAIAENQETTVSIEIFSADKPVSLSPLVSGVFREACQVNGIPYCSINSGSRHDTANMEGVAPSGIVFIPYQNSSREDYVAPLAIQAGLNVLTEALYKLAK